MNEIDALSQKIGELRASNITVDDFHQWVVASSATLSKVVSQGVLLKFKRGDMSKIMAASKVVLPPCSKCSSLFKEGEFSDRAEHASCARIVDQAMATGLLNRVGRPNWFKPNSNQLGADAYFECSSCGALWTLVEPERQYHGLWERVV